MSVFGGEYPHLTDCRSTFSPGRFASQFTARNHRTTATTLRTLPLPLDLWQTRRRRHIFPPNSPCIGTKIERLYSITSSWPPFWRGGMNHDLVLENRAYRWN